MQCLRRDSASPSILISPSVFQRRMMLLPKNEGNGSMVFCFVLCAFKKGAQCNGFLESLPAFQSDANPMSTSVPLFLSKTRCLGSALTLLGKPKHVCKSGPARNKPLEGAHNPLMLTRQRGLFMFCLALNRNRHFLKDSG